MARSTYYIPAHIYARQSGESDNVIDLSNGADA